jgi:hypothetical protein
MEDDCGQEVEIDGFALMQHAAGRSTENGYSKDQEFESIYHAHVALQGITHYFTLP